MNKNILETIKKEIRGIIRDKKSLLMMLVTPLLIPIFIFIFSYVYNEMIYSNEEVEYKVGLNYQVNDIEKEILKNNFLSYEIYSTKEDLEESYEKGHIHAYIVKEGKSYTIYANSMNELSSKASLGLISYLDTWNDYLAQNYLDTVHVDKDKIYNNISYTFEELTSGANDLVNTIVTFGFIFAVMSITLVAIYSSTDATAGEKERGTLETILTFPVKSNEFVIGKYLAIFISCIITSIISIGLALLSFSICSKMFEIYQNVVFNFGPSTIFLVFIILLAYSFFISGLCIAIASFSKSFKEAQSALTPISMLVMVPMFLNILGINMNPYIALLPIINHTLLIENLLCGTVNIYHIIIMFLSTIIYSIIIIIYITKQYKSEKILFSI